MNLISRFSKKTIILASVILLAIIAIAIILVMSLKSSDKLGNFVNYKDPQLTQEQKQPFINKVNEIEKKISELEDKKGTDAYQLYLELASNYSPLGEFKKSRDNYLIAADLFPEEPLPWYAAATIEVSMGDFDSAIKHVTKSLEINGNNTDYWNFKLDLMRYNLNASEETMRVEIQKALKATGDHVDVITYNASYLNSIGDLVGAVAEWKKAMEKNPDNSTTYQAEIKRIQDKLK